MILEAVTEVVVGFDVFRIDAKRLAVSSDCSVDRGRFRQRIAEVIECIGRIRLQPKSLTAGGGGFLGFTVRDKGAPQIAMDDGGIGFEADGLPE